jgi:hypothetical protein
MKMKLHTLWKIWDDDNVELLFALDEYTVEQNWEAWEDGCKAARDRYKITEADTREVLIDVPYKPIVAVFQPVQIEGEIGETS